jgi:hypothetical protein
MNELTAEDIEANARRAGWEISAERAAQIAATAAPRLAAFNRVRSSLAFDDDMSINVVLEETRYMEYEEMDKP